ncbi:MAG TPA: FAD-dependent oxidoreductase, partial [Dysgonamonadaceae bacterium]|nr:FAD-dependent oxidoreductase [Dysgonamonadaceae bacterium]
FNKHVAAVKRQNLSLFYWLQTEAPRPDGGEGWAGLRLRGDIMGTEDGMAKYPYIREARRIKAEFTVLEEHVGAENRKLVAGAEAGIKAADFYDSVGVGYYHIDLHPSSRGNNYIDFPSLPFEIPLGSLLPQRVNNLLPANKNIGTTHITNGCYRLHPVEWSIGEAVGMLISYAKKKDVPLRAIRENRSMLKDFQNWIQKQGVEIKWK